jgi:hypothetical protein
MGVEETRHVIHKWQPVTLLTAHFLKEYVTERAKLCLKGKKFNYLNGKLPGK